MSEQINVFQEMALHGPAERREELRDALIAATSEPWQVDLERSEELTLNAITPQDVISFYRTAGDSYPAASLSLWETDDGYYIPNVVPREFGTLTIIQYNAILTDFVERVAQPIADKLGFKIVTSPPRQGPSDWLSHDAATKLQRFSRAANKSTGASHPLDEQRWFDFLVAAHRSELKPDSERLARWLQEVERWDEASAHQLAGDYESSLSLLKYYDEN